MKIKLMAKVVYEWEYEADPEAYGTDDPEAVRRIDEENLADDTVLFIQNHVPTITVTVVKDEG